MYEAHFGFTGTPFGLNPDPAFYFGSKGHSHALSYMKFGVHQGEGFVVVTGEIGAGKTTLVRTLLAELDSERIVAAQIVSTQLEAGDLLRSVALAFGIAPKNLSKAELIATIEAFLTLLVTQEKRALLIVDEAQNLSREAVEELRMLSNFQLGNQALLQSFLVGQPELRVLLTSKPMEQFRQRVIASCHLGPMEAGETRVYVEHRLRQVGWSGRPAIDDAAFERIHEWSGGVPRRVNLLCNRLLLSAYLNERGTIDAALVEAVAEEMQGPAAAPARHTVAAAHARELVSAAPVGHGAVAARAAGDVPSAATSAAVGSSIVPGAPHAAQGPLLAVSAGPLDDVKLAMLLAALKGQVGVPACLRVRVGRPESFRRNDLFVARQGVDAGVIELDVRASDATQRLASLLQQLGALAAEHAVSGLLVVGASDEALACGLVARRHGCPLVHLEAGGRAGATAIDALVIDRLASLLYASDHGAYLRLVREGADDTAVHPGGSLLADAVRAAAHRPPALATIHASLRPCGSHAEPIDLDSPFGFVTVDGVLRDGDAAALRELAETLQELARELPILWLVGSEAQARLQALDLASSKERVAMVESVSFPEQIALLNAAEWVVSDCADLQFAAAALQVRRLPLGERWPALSVLGAEAPKSGDGPAAERIAEHFAAWWRQRSTASR